MSEHQPVKNGLDLAKTAIELLQLLIVSILAIVILVWPNVIYDRLVQLHVSKIEVGGVTYELEKVKTTIEVAADQIPKLQANLQSAQIDLNRITAEHNKAVQSLSALLAAEARGARPSANDLAAANALVNGNPTIDKTLAARNEERSQAVDQAGRATTELATAVNGTGGFAVIFGGDTSESSARSELVRAAKFGEAVIYKRQGSYRSAIRFKTQADAAAVLPAIRRLSPYTAGAYVVDLNKWCPRPVAADDALLDCQF